LDALRAHAEDCDAVRGRFFDLRCNADAVRAFAASRIVSTSLSILVVLALIFWLVD